MPDLFDAAEPESIIGVSELIGALRERLASEFSELWVEGEIGQVFRSGAGHFYFDLRDESAQLRCVMFQASARHLLFDPEEGMQVRARGRLDVYAERGALQLIADELRPAGEGALRLAFERLKRRLYDEGVFSDEHKRELPFQPECVGLVTSLRGAAIHDFVRALRKRRASLELLVVDAPVQGDGAWRGLVRGLHLLDAHPRVSVIVLTRGGGSLEDLWSFNREELVRAIHELETPVISAIGHEVDLVLSDLVADARAATPTAAAELVAPDTALLERQVDGLRRRLVGRQRAILAHQGQRLEALRRGLVHPAERLEALGRRLRAAHSRLLPATQRDLARRQGELARQRAALLRAAERASERRAATLATLRARLEALSPLAVLERGYAIARRVSDGGILRSTGEAAAGTELDLRLADGSLRATVTGPAEDA